MTADASSPAASKRSTLSARVERIFDHAADTRSLFLLSTGRKLRFAPGQFISISIPLGDETRSRPYTIASNPSDAGPFEICFNRVPGGRGVEWLFERRVGDTIEFAGPFGTFTLDANPAANVEIGFIAEGTAIAPIRPMLKRALAGPGSRAKIHLIYAAQDREHILYSTELEELARTAANFSYEALIAPPENIYKRLRESINARWILADSDRTRQFYICGVGDGVIQLRDLLRGSGYERRAVHYERW